ncbi:multicopper oxidase, type 2 [Candidatus Koribacter versatilis Ellin345]|uniref:Multicopper oxidase, type 2 n=1 Tax=Koribacter versatilis (strain Ellin345) TaxID=204669 RepID=Q1IPS1_KORVE|nr:multicopper oxidase domain-containing protein [Candidatus Koribacter versatilis]ABF41129.1 multicopper oxidase, type 2 [Candidatus Koribacter versatilis Ellin345]
MFRWLSSLFAFTFLLYPALARAATEACPRPALGSVVQEPPDLFSHNGVLELTLTARNAAATNGSARYCFIDASGNESPTLRVKPGDLVTIHLKNELTNITPDKTSPHQHHASASTGPCTGGAMTPVTTNLHFHGLTIPPTCHQDEVLQTLIHPGDPVFDYSFRIPDDEPPGLYWYHPHVHGFSRVELLGGASGALIVEGTERADRAVAGLPERVFVIRDQDLVNPNAPSAKSEPVIPKFLLDNDGDAVNTGTGFGKPAKDLSINFVTVPYPNYEPATILMKPGERQLWRVLNASAITYLNLSILRNRAAQRVGLIAIDGVPLNLNGGPADFVDWQTHIGLPPGSRAEFIVEAPEAGVSEAFVTHTVDTGPGGENDPNRPLAIIRSSADAPEPRVKLDAAPQPLPAPKQPWLGSVAPTQVRKFYFSEKLDDPNNPASASEFYITEEGHTPRAFDPNSKQPDVTVTQGTVEDWIIENRSSELHAFHIHQLHFMLLDYDGKTVNEPFLRDIVNVPYFNGHTLSYPSIRIRMDFRDPNIVGTFAFHCHLLEHEDRGMMATIQVVPSETTRNTPSKAALDAPKGVAR